MKIQFAISFLLIAHLISFKVEAQKITILEEGMANDSSYYDIYKVNDNEYWFGGKYGILKKVDSSGNISMIEYPNEGTHILNIKSFDEDNIIISGDKGMILQYNRTDNKWQKTYLKNYSRSTFYKIITINDSTAYVSGGSSKVAFGSIDLPSGFILKTTDKGKSWKKIYSNLTNMIWDIIHDPANDKLYASIFSPFRGNIITSPIGDEKWKKIGTGKEMLIHAMKYEDGLIIAGTSRRNINRLAIIDDRSNDDALYYSEIGTIWSINTTSDIKLFTASNGYIFFDIKNGGLQRTRVSVKKNLYESSKIGPSSFYIVGSKKTLLRVDFSEPVEHVQNQ